MTKCLIDIIIMGMVKNLIESHNPMLVAFEGEECNNIFVPSL